VESEWSLSGVQADSTNHILSSWCAESEHSPSIVQAESEHSVSGVQVESEQCGVHAPCACIGVAPVVAVSAGGPSSYMSGSGVNFGAVPTVGLVVPHSIIPVAGSPFVPLTGGGPIVISLAIACPVVLVIGLAFLVAFPAVIILSGGSFVGGLALVAFSAIVIPPRCVFMGSLTLLPTGVIVTVRTAVISRIVIPRAVIAGVIVSRVTRATRAAVVISGSTCWGCGCLGILLKLRMVEAASGRDSRLTRE
jgi:hypothetical protein